MRVRWKLVLPILAIIAFGVESVASFRVNQHLATTRGKYYWWSSIRLDTDPLNKHPEAHAWCKPGQENCQEQFTFVWIDSSYATRLLEVLALPAFALGGVLVGGLAKFGINEVWSFMALVPFLVVTWFYLVGWLVERCLAKFGRTSPPIPS
jgi:hypothetical protein